MGWQQAAPGNYLSISTSLAPFRPRPRLRLLTLTPQLHVTRPKSRILVISVRNKKPGSKSRALRKNLKENRSSEHSSWEQLSRKRTRLFSYLDLSGSKDFALWECVKFS
jgi:hypothetical protein